MAAAVAPSLHSLRNNAIRSTVHGSLCIKANSVQSRAR
jgi:hypothetical protein